MKNPSALLTLDRVLRDLKEDPMVRQEVAEAMGAISSVQSIPTLKGFLTDERREVRETCEIALSGTNQKKARPKRRNLKRRARRSTCIRLLPLLVDLNFFFGRHFISEDPAPSSLLRPSSRSSTSYTDADVSTLTKTLLDPSFSLFVR